MSTAENHGENDMNDSKCQFVLISSEIDRADPTYRQHFPLMMQLGRAVPPK